ncbi:hypothetical protein BCY88_09815 [Paraburkholderia fungorum]|uniref:Uncharacterized protein n=1 Tax=Paraburkholderia fungorum TaxID=134537 RepID=A0A3R7I5N5_9BURK|nr:hypothetical protein BCY88_09815 [Paraburkholderia fungorum]
MTRYCVSPLRYGRYLRDSGLFGANVSIIPKLIPGEKAQKALGLVVDEDVKSVGTSGRNLEKSMPLLKQAGVTIN